MFAQACEESTRAKGRLVRIGPFEWTGLPEPPTLTVYLPADYDASQRRHPLAIFFDGQNMFDDEGSYRGGWQLHRQLDWRACRGLPVPIAVAIHTAGWSRGSILSPWPHDGQAGLGDRTLDWLTRWLIPTLRKELRVEPGPESVLLGGSSLGGLLSLYGFFRHPDHIGRVIAMSPSIAMAGGPFAAWVRESSRSGGTIYLDAGGRECECTSILRDTRELAELLTHKGWRMGDDLLFLPDPDGAHDERSWKRRLPGALQFALRR